MTRVIKSQSSFPLCHCRKQSSCKSPLWHKHLKFPTNSSHSLQNQVVSISLQKESNNVSIELPTLSSTGRVPTQLVSSVDPSLVLVVQLNCLRTADGIASVVLLPLENRHCCRWLGIGKHHHYHLSVHPCTRTDIFLNYLWVSPVKVYGVWEHVFYVYMCVMCTCGYPCL